MMYEFLSEPKLEKISSIKGFQTEKFQNDKNFPFHPIQKDTFYKPM